MQLFDSLEYLDNLVNEVFGNIEKKVPLTPNRPMFMQGFGGRLRGSAVRLGTGVVLRNGA